MIKYQKEIFKFTTLRNPLSNETLLKIVTLKNLNDVSHQQNLNKKIAPVIYNMRIKSKILKRKIGRLKIEID